MALARMVGQGWTSPYVRLLCERVVETVLILANFQKIIHEEVFERSVDLRVRPKPQSKILCVQRSVKGKTGAAEPKVKHSLLQLLSVLGHNGRGPHHIALARFGSSVHNNAPCQPSLLVLHGQRRLAIHQDYHPRDVHSQLTAQ